MYRPSRETCEELAYREAEGVEVSETGQRLVLESVQIIVLYVPVNLIHAVFRSALIRHLVGVLELERIGNGGAGHARPLVRLVLPPSHELKKNHTSL